MDAERSMTINSRLRTAKRRATFVAEFKQAFPRKKVQDVLYYAELAGRVSKKLVGAQTRKGQNACLQLPVRMGIPRSTAVRRLSTARSSRSVFHALNVPQLKTATGGGPVAMALQDKVAGAWVNFAKTGNPSQPGLE